MLARTHGRCGPGLGSGRRKEGRRWGHARDRSGGGGDDGADDHGCGMTLLTCRRHVFAPQHDGDLDISLGGGMAKGALFTAS